MPSVVLWNLHRLGIFVSFMVKSGSLPVKSREILDSWFLIQMSLDLYKSVAGRQRCIAGL